MFEKKLKPRDLEELRKRTDLINQYLLIAKALDFQVQIFIKNQLLPQYGLDLTKNYSIDVKSGKIKITAQAPQADAKSTPVPVSR